MDGNSVAARTKEGNRLPVELPYEIEQAIFSLAASSFPECVATFSVVSRYVQAWVEAVIYQNIVLGFPLSRNTLFLRTVDSRPASFFSTHVKRLYIQTIVPYNDAQRVLAVCKSAETVLYWCDVAPGSAVSSLLPSDTLSQLSVRFDTFSPRANTLTLGDLFSGGFKRLTHLEIVSPPHDAEIPLGALPNLTHLAIGSLYSDQHFYLIPLFAEWLACSATLQVLIVISDDPVFLQHLDVEGSKDARLVTRPTFFYPKSAYEYWEDVRLGLYDFWSVEKRD